MHKKKVFCVGFHKTGTSSIGTALEILGYQVKGYDSSILPFIKNEEYRPVKSIISQYDAFQDNPWPLIYEYLDQNYPDSKFILTIRDPENWYKSISKHLGGSTTKMREWIYGRGDPLNNKDIYINKYPYIFAI